MKKKTIINLVLILAVLSLFVTPLGYECKVLLQRVFAGSVEILPKDKQYTIDCDWKLKDRNNAEFNFAQSKEHGKAAVVYFWSSWRIVSVADLYAIEKLYNDYKDKVDFYIITNELSAPVDKLMAKRGFNFKVTYLIIGEKMPFNAEEIPSGFVVDKNGVVRAQKIGTGRWNSDAVRQLLDELSK